MGASALSSDIRGQVEERVRYLLSQQDRDPWSPTYGCLDRRFWGWKLVDFPEATFQRNVYALSSTYADPSSEYHMNPALHSSIVAGLQYAANIQHHDGSFDQAFPHEHSFGATAFMLHPLLEAFKCVAEALQGHTRRKLEHSLRRAAGFLCRYGEEHGNISNHLAGAVLALLNCSRFFGEARFQKRSEVLLNHILVNQSPEGWFQEYEGADPGYQTLCLYYLAQVYRSNPSPRLRESLEKALLFISHFIHPDGTFAGEYGSRRTALFYPGGVALLAHDFPLARSITMAMCRSISGGKTVTLRDVDMGNLAPLLANYISLLQSGVLTEAPSGPHLPWEQSELKQDFAQAGLYVRGTDDYYAIMGVSNGGVLKVFDKKTGKALWDDGGYIGQLKNGTLITTQMTLSDRPCAVNGDKITVTSAFFKVLRAMPNPLRFILLRLLGMTVMRSLRIGNMIKKALVRMLISGKRPYPMELKRQIKFEKRRVLVKDRLALSAGLKLHSLAFGKKFIAIHMASAKYFEGPQLEPSIPGPWIDMDRLNRERHLEVQFSIGVEHA